jgi:hypothetical protein
MAAQVAFGKGIRLGMVVSSKPFVNSDVERQRRQ